MFDNANSFGVSLQTYFGHCGVEQQLQSDMLACNFRLRANALLDSPLLCFIHPDPPIVPARQGPRGPFSPQMLEQNVWGRHVRGFSESLGRTHFVIQKSTLALQDF